MREKHKTISWRQFNSVEDIRKSENSALADMLQSKADHTLLALFTTGTRVSRLIDLYEFGDKSFAARTISGMKFPFYIMDDDAKLNQNSLNTLKNDVFGGSDKIEFVLTTSEEILQNVQADIKESLIKRFQ